MGTTTSHRPVPFGRRLLSLVRQERSTLRETRGRRRRCPATPSDASWPRRTWVLCSAWSGSAVCRMVCSSGWHGARRRCSRNGAVVPPTVQVPRWLRLPERVTPRNVHVSRRCPARVASPSAHRPTAPRRGGLGSRAHAHVARRVTTPGGQRCASDRGWHHTTPSSLERLRDAAPGRRGFPPRSPPRASPSGSARWRRTTRMRPPWGPPASLGSLPPASSPPAFRQRRITRSRRGAPTRGCPTRRRPPWSTLPKTCRRSAA